MPTPIVTFPQVNRSGTQQTPYVQLGASYTEIQLTSIASDATHSDPANGIQFDVLWSPTGVDADSKVIQREGWTGGTVTPKGGSVAVPNAVNVTFGPIPATGFVSLRAVFNRLMTIGATLTGLP